MKLAKCTCKKPETVNLIHSSLAKIVNYCCLGCNAHQHGPKDSPTNYSGKEWETLMNTETV